MLVNKIAEFFIQKNKVHALFTGACHRVLHQAARLYSVFQHRTSSIPILILLPLILIDSLLRPYVYKFFSVLCLLNAQLISSSSFDDPDNI